MNRLAILYQTLLAIKDTGDTAMFELHRTNAKIAETAEIAEGYGAGSRSAYRQTAILHVGLLDANDGSIFCLVRNISSLGIQVKPYGRLAEGGNISVRVGDESPIPATVAWGRDGLVGIRFGQPLNPQALLRIGQKMAGSQRRFSARASTDRRGYLRTGGVRYSIGIRDLTTVGARLRTADPVSFGETTLLDVPGLPSLKVSVRRSDGPEHDVSFQTPLPLEILSDLLSR